ncbi:N-acetylmuramic acid 6-phosphate etherase [Jeotgalibaca sp. MA1X17-3]|uniref:N-acetylmuramic acid 6-phosphate etherase n=1 Tax=Jeotgalibaca sp. MA1X17-3 TaxID=2908211 RepID=UPI001F1AE15C|nr:N-acetylmuramic acid 6-phosphate etherase [Jeotgalibaca sp. MA1X17-3]UJF14684.1 N-acetylmuramic acid 6-phosphate etherase [Jeotgalibaca sp. MA1X17-3]
MESLNLAKLETEQQNQKSLKIDRVSTKEMLEMMNDEDLTVSKSVRKEIPTISKIVDLVYTSLENGGRLFYIGAGTSGRLGVLDASECPPTFGVSYELVQGLIAGGEKAILKAQEGVEDQPEEGKKDLISRNLTSKDVVIGIAASGRTPYVTGALNYAKEIGASSASISCVSKAKISEAADIALEIITGPEIITGSTRLKAGTAQKMILNMITTSVMIKLGKVYQNYMVDLQPTNKKLVSRAQEMIRDITGVDQSKAIELYEAANGHVKTAIMMELGGFSADCARKQLELNKGHISRAIRKVEKE